MIINYSDSDVIIDNHSIFLAGPTPRKIEIKSWRIEALKILKDLDYQGVVYVPELEHDNREFDYINQINWERKALENSSKIIFWIPRELPDMPAFTTNVEFGYWMAKDPLKCYFGRPDNSQKNKYLDKLYLYETARQPCNNLKELLKSVL